MVTQGLKAFLPQPPLGGSVVPQQRHRQPAQPRQVLRPMLRPRPALVLAAHHPQSPRPIGLDPPEPTGSAPPASSRIDNNRGMAGISLDFGSVATCPSVR